MATPPKPRTETLRTDLVRLPRLTRGRMFVRRLLRGLARLLVWLFTKAEVRGLENVPPQGPVLAVTNHLGDADLVVGMAFSPRIPDTLAKVELYDFPLLGKLLDAYGVIWVHRGQPDRRALRVTLEGLEEGRLVIIAPEGRESVTGSLEEGTNGAAFLALKANAPILPVTLTGTENSRIFGNMRRLRRTPVTLTIGAPFRLKEVVEAGNGSGDGAISRLQAVERGTQVIMEALARQLPPEYQGVYRLETEAYDES